MPEPIRTPHGASLLPRALTHAEEAAIKAAFPTPPDLMERVDAVVLTAAVLMYAEVITEYCPAGPARDAMLRQLAGVHLGTCQLLRGPLVNAELDPRD